MSLAISVCGIEITARAITVVGEALPGTKVGSGGFETGYEGLGGSGDGGGGEGGGGEGGGCFCITYYLR